MPLTPRNPARPPLRKLLRPHPRPRESRQEPPAPRPGGIDYARLQMPIIERRRLELREDAERLRMQALVAARTGDHEGAEDFRRTARARELQAAADDPTIEITPDQVDELETVQ